MAGTTPDTATATAAPANPLSMSDDFIAQMSTKFTALANSLSTDLVNKLMNPPGSPGAVRSQERRLLDNWNDASNNYRRAPFELSLAEKNYYNYNSGESGGDEVYNIVIIDRFAQTANELKKNSIDKQQEFMADITQSLKQYQGEKLFAERTLQLLQIRLKENEDLLKKIDMYNRILQTSERKVVYEINDTTGLYTWRRALLFLYYSVLVSYIIFGNFIPDKLYLNKMVWFLIVIACVIPLILNLVIKWVFIIAEVLAFWFNTRVHKDVYADLKGGESYGVSSYTDIPVGPALPVATNPITIPPTTSTNASS
jgi:hypothetical protein